MTFYEKAIHTGLSTQGRCAWVPILQVHMLLSGRMHDLALPSQFELTDAFFRLRCHFSREVICCVVNVA